MKQALTILGICLACLLAICAVNTLAADTNIKRPSRTHHALFEGTPNELHVYRVYGAENGQTLMIIGGIQGDEPGGFLSADLYADLDLAKGNLIVVPRANFYSIIRNHRGPDGDMNRQFGDPIKVKRHKKIIGVLKDLMSQSDCLLNLHDGSGFYRTKWENNMANPMRYGQSIIADASTFETSGGKVLNLEEMANKVIAKVNPQIKNPYHHLSFNNHRTTKQDSKHKEQRLSATYYALLKCNIPAFGIETSKSLPSQALKVRHHNLVINAFMDEMDIVAENPGFNLEPPELRYLVISVNQHLPVVIPKGETLYVQKGDRIVVTQVEANYERGLSCDILGVGGVSDMSRAHIVEADSKILVRKDAKEIGHVNLKIGQPVAGGTMNLAGKELYFICEVDGARHLVADGEELQVVSGDSFKLVEVLSNLTEQTGIKVNLKGFVSEAAKKNSGEDRGYVVDTAHDMISRFSKCKVRSEGKGCYKVVATKNGSKIGRMTLVILPAKLDYIVLRKNKGPKMVFHHGEIVKAEKGDRLEILDYKSNVTASNGMSLMLSGKGGTLKVKHGNINSANPEVAHLFKLSSNGLQLMVMRNNLSIGHIELHLGGN